jgi:hypothetical protein
VAPLAPPLTRMVTVPALPLSDDGEGEGCCDRDGEDCSD